MEQKIEELKEKRNLLYAELIEKLKPYSDKGVWFVCEENKKNCVMTFYIPGEFKLTLTRKWAAEEGDVEMEVDLLTNDTRGTDTQSE